MREASQGVSRRGLVVLQLAKSPRSMQRRLHKRANLKYDLSSIRFHCDTKRWYVNYMGFFKGHSIGNRVPCGMSHETTHL